MRKMLALGLASLGLLAVSAVRGRSQEGPSADLPTWPPEASRPLDLEAFGVRLRLGVEDAKSRRWDGKVAVDRGEVIGVEPWRFRRGDAVAADGSWTARSLPIRKAAAPAAKKAARKKAVARKEEKGGPANTGPAITPTGVVVRLKAPADASLTLTTDEGEAVVALDEDLRSGAPRRILDGRVEARVVPSHAPLIVGPFQQDFPAAVADGQGGAWVAYVEHRPRGPEVSEALLERPKDFRGFVPEGGGDQIKLLHFVAGRGEGRVDREVDVTDPGLDVWRPAVTVAAGKVIVVWSEQKGGNWDLYARRLDIAAGTWAEVERLTTAPGTDTDVALTTDPHGNAWMAWQSFRDGQADILMGPVAPTKDHSMIEVAASPANEWSPAIVADADSAYVAYDTYAKGDHDVRLARVSAKVAGSGVVRTIAVAETSRFEARPGLALGGGGRVWVAYEERPANWGKDFGNIPDDPGSGLYQASTVRVRLVEGDTVREVADPLAQAPEAERKMNAYARLVVDATGHPRLLFRHRQEAIWGGNSVMVVGAVWVEMATSLVGGRWTPPQPLPRSDNLLDNRPALVPRDDGGVLVVYSGDGRLHREVEHAPGLSRRFYSHSGTPPGVVDDDLFVAALPSLGAAPAPEALGAVVAEPPAPPAHADEAGDVARMRSHRIAAGGKTYQFLRGEFHRHTEISQDGGNDGSLEDMWRYALDAATLDWIGNGDHDNGGGKEYTWWLVQKTTDLYHAPPAFVPMFTYERSVPYPGGHRNVMFPRRGVRTLPRLVDEDGVRTNNRQGQDEDAAMLYAYLNEMDGLCAAHTSATGMGTDWRANDPKAEPIVEIYQGIRDSYEHLGGPRVARRASEATGGFRPLGMVWNALAMQYRLGFQASSDHVSTHISFAVALAESPTRAAIFDAFRRRHCYGATDNILLDVRSGEHLMGDEFDTAGPVSIRVLAHGTATIARIDVIKDFAHVFTTEPKAQRVEFTWTDDERRPPGLSWYYVRVIQEDGEVAWASPMWVHTRAAPGGE